MRSFLAPMCPRSAPSPSLSLVLALLTLAGCNGGDLECRGPFCVAPPGQAVATRLQAGAGDGQSGAPGRELLLPVEALVTDDSGRPIPDVEVAFVVGEGGGTLSAATARSDLQGRAQVRWTLGATPGAQTILASATNSLGAALAGSPLTLTAEAVQPAPARIVLRQPPSDVAQHAIALERQPVVDVLDAEDQPVPQVEISVSISSGGGALGGTTAILTDAAGRATYPDLAILGTVGPRTLRFAVTSTSLETTAAVELRAGAPVRIAGNEPLLYEAVVNSPVDPAPSVIVRDDAGNPVPGVTVEFVPDRDATVSPSTVVTDDFGAAQVTSWTLGSTADVRYTLTARVQGSTGDPVVFSGDARAGAAGRLQIVVQPSETALSGTPFARQPAVRAVDRSGNPTPQAGVPIRATLSSGPAGALQGTLATTNASGVATFSSLTLTGLVGDYTITFSAPTLGGATSERITLTAGSAIRIALAQQPSASGRSRVALATQPVIQLQDARGNPVPQAGVSVTAGIASGGGTLAGEPTVLTGADGRAVYSGLAIVGPPGTRTLRFTSASPSGEVVSGPIRLPGVANITRLTTPPAAVVVGSVLQSAVSWSLTDAQDQPVADVPVSFSAAPGNTLSPTSAVSDGSGIVRLDSWAVSTTSGEQHAQLEVPGVGVSRVEIATVAGAPVGMEMVSGNGQTAEVNTQLLDPLVVRVTDQFGNGVSGVTVAWRTCEGAGDYDVATDAGGFASAFQTASSEPGAYCVAASSSALAGIRVEFTFTATAPAGTVSEP